MGVLFVGQELTLYATMKLLFDCRCGLWRFDSIKAIIWLMAQRVVTRIPSFPLAVASLLWTLWMQATWYSAVFVVLGSTVWLISHFVFC